MRLICLLLAGLIPIYAYCQTASPNDHPFDDYDSLSKYSYLILVSMRKSNSGVETSPRVSTGFFFREGKRLYLLCAHHIFGGLSIQDNDAEKSVPYKMEVCYKDRAGNLQRRHVPLPKFKKCLCPRNDLFDVQAIDVTSYFRHTWINSIEDMVANYDESDDERLNKGDSVIVFGFSDMVDTVSYDSIQQKIPIPPRKVMGIGMSASEVLTDTINRNHYSEYLYFVFPPLRRGASGAPFFLIRRKGGVRRPPLFIGVQSESNDKNPHSIIVRAIRVIKDYHLKEYRSTL